MAEDNQASTLPLLDALMTWGNPKLVAAIARAEREYTLRQLSRWQGARICPDEELEPPDPDDMRGGGPYFRGLEVAWEQATDDFKAQIERGALYLQAVKLVPEMNSPRAPIRSDYASELKIDFRSMTFILFRNKYGSIAVSRKPFATLSAPQPISTVAPGATEVRDMTDDQVLELVDHHVRRVTEADGPMILARIRNVLQPIINRRLTVRADRGELHETLAAEAKEMAQWVAKVATWHPVLTARTIENNIRDRYWTLKPRSKPTK